MTPQSTSRHPSPSTHVSGVVLAAGAGTRMGQPKLLLPVGGRPLLAWVVDLVDGLPLDERVIVLGAQAEAVYDALFAPHPCSLPQGGKESGDADASRQPVPMPDRSIDPLFHSTAAHVRRSVVGADLRRCAVAAPPHGRGIRSPSPSAERDRRGTRHEAARDNVWRIVHNPRWREGMGSSLRRASEALNGGGMLVFLGDMPWVSEDAARAVLSQVGDRPVAPAYRGERGFPVYLPPSLRSQIQTLVEDKGARELLRGCELIPWPNDEVIRDVDRAEDLLHA